MVTTRRRVTRLIAGMLAWAAAAIVLVGPVPQAAAATETWRIIVPFSAGGSNDLAARMLAERLRQTGPANVVVENQVGANGNIGAATVARSAPDGATMLFTSDGYATVNPLLFKDSMKFDATDLMPVAIVGFQPALLVVNASGPLRSLEDLVRRGREASVTYASGGIGSAGHLTMGYLGHVARLNLTHVPHAGGAPAMNSLLGNHVEAAFVAIPNALPHVRSGKLRALAVSSPKRLPQLPDIPTIAESGHPGFETQIAALVAVSSKTPAPRIERLSGLIRDAVAQPDFLKFLDSGGFIPADLGSADASRWLAVEGERWRDLIVKQRIIE